jgi:hypothetical protein
MAENYVAAPPSQRRSVVYTVLVVGFLLLLVGIVLWARPFILFVYGGGDPQLAVTQERWDMLGMYARFGQLEVIDRFGREPLHTAVSTQQPEMIAWLLAQGVNSNGSAQSELTPLGLAVRLDHKEEAELLLQAGANPALPGKGVQTAIDEAALLNRAEMLDTMLSRGSDEPTLNATLSAALHTAVMERHLESVKVLLAHGAPVNGVPPGNHSILDSAVQAKRIYRVLREHGARHEDLESAIWGEALDDVARLCATAMQPAAETAADDTPRETADTLRSTGYLTSPRMDRNRAMDSALSTAVSTNSAEALRILLDCMGTAATENGTRAVVTALANGKFDMATLLWEFGASHDLSDRAVQEGLKYAVLNEHFEVFELYRAAAGRTFSLNELNWAPPFDQIALHYTISENKPEAFRRLWGLGLRPELNAVDTRTALSIARRKEHTEVLTVFEKLTGVVVDELRQVPMTPIPETRSRGVRVPAGDPRLQR